MIKTIRYCDICGKELHEHFDPFYDLSLPLSDGMNIIDIIKSDVCSACAVKLYWKIDELKHPNRKCPD